MNKLPISIIKYLCFGCEKCKDTENELFVYICTIYNKVYLGYKKKRVYFFYITEHDPNERLLVSVFKDIEHVLEDMNMSKRITSFSELMERIEGCG